MRAPAQSRPSRGRTVDRRHQKDQRRMKAMLLRGPNLPFEPVELPDPAPGPGEAVARVITCGSGLTIQHVKAGRRARVKPGDTVAIFGAGGGVGIHQVMMAKWAHARVIAIDIAAAKFDACRKAGADEVINPHNCDAAAALLDLTHGEGVDVVIDYVSATSTLE